MKATKELKKRLYCKEKILQGLAFYCQGKRTLHKLDTISRLCERSEAIQIEYLKNNRSGLLHFVRKDDN